jgi:hypothetical protein
MQLYVGSYCRALLLGISKANRKVDGFTYSSRKRPHWLKQSTPSFFYDLGDPSHVKAFLASSRAMVAFSAGLRDRSRFFKRPYRLKPGETRELVRTPIRALWCPTHNHIVNADGYEVVEVIGASIQDESPYLNPKVHRKAITFRIKRFVVDHNRETNAYPYRPSAFVTKTTYIDIPEAAVEQFASNAEKLLRKIYTYLSRYPDQSNLRYDYQSASKQRKRWQLHFPEKIFDELLLPQLRYTFAYKTEDLLFHKRGRRKKLYNPQLPRSLPPSEREDPHSWCLYPKLHPLYLQRIYHLERGELCWHPSWKQSEYEARNDLAKIKLHYLSRHAFIFWFTKIATLCLKKDEPEKTWPSLFLTLLSPLIPVFSHIPIDHTNGCWCSQYIKKHQPEVRGPPR